MKLLSYFVSIPFAICMYGILLIMHPFQWLAYKMIGKEAQRKVVDTMSWLICRCLGLLGTRIKIVKSNKPIPPNKPVIVVANHQSMFDVSPIGWHLRKNRMNYVSKIELAKGVPSLSLNLKYGDSIAIDRKNPEQSKQKIKELAHIMKEDKSAVLFFPEGTRSRDGVPKNFKHKGLKYFLEIIPDAIIQPVSVSNSWKIFRYGIYPFGLFSKMRFYFHDPVSLAEYPNQEALINNLEQIILSEVQN